MGAFLKRFRPNILILFGFGYTTVTIGLVAMVVNGTPAYEAYEALKGPISTLIGGSLTIAKDVLRSDDGDDKGE